jgi:hypothetical protein
MKRTCAYRGSAVLSSGRRSALELALAVLLLVPVCASASARAGASADTSSLDSPVHTETIRLPLPAAEIILRFTGLKGTVDAGGRPPAL